MITPQQLRNVYQSWKSTITGLLGAAIAITLAIVELPPKPKFAVIVLAVARCLIDLMKKDAGQQEVETEDNPNPHSVPSVETPVDPNATPVTMEGKE